MGGPTPTPTPSGVPNFGSSPRPSITYPPGMTPPPGATPSATPTASTAGQNVMSGGGVGNFDPNAALGGGKPGGLTKAEQIKQYTTETQSADYTTVQYVANQVYQNLMGRNARPDEIQSLYQQFNDYAKKNPIYTRTAEYNIGGTGAANAFTAGYAPTRDITAQRNALSVSDFVNAMVQTQPEAQAFGAAKTYMQAIRDYLNQYRSSI